MEYITNYPIAEYCIIDEMANNPTFKEFVEQCTQHPDTNRLDMKNFVNWPIPRLARYELLLKGIMEASHDGHEDHESIPQVIEVINSLLEETQPGIASVEQKVELWRYNANLVFKPGEAVDMDLLAKNRSLIHTGKLLRQPDTGFEWSGWSELFVLLFDNYLVMTRPKEKDGITKYNVNRRPIPLDLLTLSNFIDPPMQRGTGLLRGFGGNKGGGDTQANTPDVTPDTATDSHVVYPSASQAVTGAPQSPLGPNDSASQVAARRDIDSQVSSAVSRPSTTGPQKRRQKQPITYDDDDVTDSLAPEEENILRCSRRDWYSNCYQSFEKAQIQRDAIGKVVQTKAEDGQTYTNYVFKCKMWEETTVRSQQLMSGFSSGSKYKHEKLHTLALRWVASCRRPMSIVGDSEFLTIIKLLNPQAVVPSRNTVTQDIKIMYSLAKVNLKSILQKTKGAVHIALDVWTDINMTAWLDITLYMVQEDGYRKVPLDFIRWVSPPRHWNLELT
ncbi:hypothetical protein EDB84DRAFT_1599293 [Lactarius hengduanensis]|nr:hypothetical protein EDB84DRAFT_1599293 [Lactarius hengduanensis]